MDTTPEFHWKDGIYFRRELNGDVTMRREATATDFPPLLQVTIPAAEWASIVVHCSAAGKKDAAGAYVLFDRFHNGPVGEIANTGEIWPRETAGAASVDFKSVKDA